MIYFNHIAQDIYENSRNVIEVLGRKKANEFALNTIQNTTDKYRKEAKQNTHLRNKFEFLYAEIKNSGYDKDLLKYIGRDSLVSYKKTLYPIIKIPNSLLKFRFQNKSCIIEEIKRYCNEDEKLELILKSSNFSNKSTPLRTVYENKSPKIIGSFTSDLLGCSRLSHEFGHCISDLNGYKNTPSSLVKSEYKAHLLEELIPLQILKRQKEELIPEWHLYNRRIDALNLYFFLIEYESILNKNILFRKIEFSKSIFIRESLFTLIGYQAIYVESSIRRFSEVRKHYEKN